MDCDDGDSSHDNSMTRWLQVLLRLVATVPFDVFCRAMVVAGVNTAVMNAMNVKMISFGRSPDAFTSKPDPQVQLLPKTISDRYLTDSEKPIIGLSLSMTPLLSKDCLLLIPKPAIRRVYKVENKKPPGPFKILDGKQERRQCLQVFPIADLQECVPLEQSDEIE